MTKKIRALIIAEQANPEWVSVPLVGWMQVCAIQKVCDIHLVTHIRNKEAISRTNFPKDQVTYIEPGWTQRFLDWGASLISKKGGWTTYNALKLPMYYVFELKTWGLFKTALQKGEFDVVHRVTPLSPAIPSLITGRLKAIKVPFILGPINGGLPWPPGFRHIQREEREWLSSLRTLKEFLPYLRSMKKNAEAIIVGSKAAYLDVPEKFRHKCFYIPENGIRPEDYQESVQYNQKGPLRVAFVGRLVPLKCSDIVLEACAPLILQGKIELHLYGDGPEKGNLEKLAQDLTQGRGIVLHGWVAHKILRAELVKNQIFAFPSIKEFGGGAVIEAMALGLLPIVTNYGGIAEVVRPDCGFHIPLGDRSSMIQSLRHSLEELLRNPSQIPLMGQRSRQRILTHYTWDYKAQQVMDVYAWATHQGTKRPPHDVPEDVLKRAS